MLRKNERRKVSMFGKYWGDHVEGKLIDIIELISKYDKNISIEVLQAQEKGEYGVAQLLITDKPPNECIETISEFYKVDFYTKDNNDDTGEYKYLMLIEPLRFSYEEDWHYGGGIDKRITHNKWDFDGYYYITDSMNDYRRLCIIPYSDHAYEFDGGPNISKHEALKLVKSIVNGLNNNTLIKN